MLPNFLVIGAQKSGTTWLNKQLRYHPEIWLPPIKEIHYFDILLLPLTFPLATLLLSSRASTRYWMRSKVKKALEDVNLNRQNLGWHTRYFLLPRTDKWYASLFSPRKGQIAGEVTPNYAAINEKVVAKVYGLMPDIKIIYLLRNPIHRMWSWAAQSYNEQFGYQGLHTISDHTIMKFLQKEKHLVNSQYFTNLQRWERFFPKDKIFVGFFEQIADNPRQLLKDIDAFLELDFSEEYIPDTVHKKVNARQYPEIPDHFAHYLAQQLYGEIEQLHQRFDNEYTENWLHYALKYL
ncbi:MAG: sulfotransferase domain-containing protein [Candidatus Parabeggiatoa sp.]|nr:sulfotransferase domain-containing protein [Candidatus Parabeggiatoa sp.]